MNKRRDTSTNESKSSRFLKSMDNRTVVWFVDGPLGGRNLFITRGLTNYLCHNTRCNYSIDWNEPCPMGFFTGWDIGQYV